MTNNVRIRWPEVEWVVLDMDGTILDLAFDNYFWRELVPARYAAARGLTLEAARAELAPKFTEVAHTLPWYCTDYWSEVTGLDMAELKREIRHHIGPLQGAEQFLQAVRASRRKLWLATNAHRDSWMLKMEQTAFAPYFDAIVCSHDYGAPKEDPRFWRAFIEHRPFVPERALFVDDSLPVLHAAREFGIGQVVAIRHPDSTQPPRVVEEFAAVDRLVQLLPIS
ncbi:MAG TPA: GMP/IMP nucleotidase [Nevskiaceae bacterium]|nr:GMP/IMP nucleotidase [Nevskiaceae bacterium]